MRLITKHRPITFTYKISATDILRVCDAKYLGVVIAENLTWSNHIDYITAKANGVIGFLPRNFKHCTPNIKTCLYSSNVRPLLEYSHVLWDPYQQYIIDSLDTIQNRSEGFITQNYNFQKA